MFSVLRLITDLQTARCLANSRSWKFANSHSLAYANKESKMSLWELIIWLKGRFEIIVVLWLQFVVDIKFDVLKCLLQGTVAHTASLESTAKQG